MPSKNMLWLATVILGICLSSAKGEEPRKILPADLAKILFAEQRLPRVQLHGRFEFCTVYEHENLEPSASAEFTGEIDLADRTTHFDLQNYKSPIYNSSEPKLHSVFSVTFDGEKWVVVDGEKGAKLPFGIVAIGTITSDRPPRFLGALDELCFPLFAPLSVLQMDKRYIPLRQVLEGKEPSLKTATHMAGSLLTLTVDAGWFTDEFTFDVSKNYAMICRRTDFNSGVHPPNRSSNRIINELLVKEFSQSGDFWFPKSAEFTQTVNDMVCIRRSYEVSDAKIITDAKPIEAVLPPNIYVNDNRTGTAYRSDAIPGASPPSQ